MASLVRRISLRLSHEVTDLYLLEGYLGVPTIPEDEEPHLAPPSTDEHPVDDVTQSVAPTEHKRRSWRIPLPLALTPMKNHDEDTSPMTSTPMPSPAMPPSPLARVFGAVAKALARSP